MLLGFTRQACQTHLAVTVQCPIVAETANRPALTDPNNPLIRMSGRDSRANPPLCQLLAQLVLSSITCTVVSGRVLVRTRASCPRRVRCQRAWFLWNHSAGSWLFLAAQPWRSRIVSIVVSAS